MVRLIPRKTKVKFEFFRGVTGLDVLLGAIFLAIAIILFTANFPYHAWIGLAWVIVAVSLFFKFADDDRFYTTLVYLLKFSVQKKKFVNMMQRMNMQVISPRVGCMIGLQDEGMKEQAVLCLR